MTIYAAITEAGRDHRVTVRRDETGRYRASTPEGTRGQTQDSVEGSIESLREMIRLEAMVYGEEG